MNTEESPKEALIRQICLDKISVHVSHVTSMDDVCWMHNLELEHHYDVVTHGLVTSLHAYVAGEQLPEKAVTYPTTAWDAFKLACFPKWMLRTWPANVTTLQVSLAVMYPKLKVALPNEPHTRHFSIYEYTTPVTAWNGGKIE